MLKRNLVAVYFFFSVVATGQPPESFISFYGVSPNVLAESYGVAETSYGYMLAGINYDTLNNQGYWGYCVKGIDTMGNELWEKKYGNPANTLYNGKKNKEYLKEVDGFYYSILIFPKEEALLCTVAATSALVKLNEMGDTLWIKEYPADETDSVLILRNLSKTYDGGFILTGTTMSCGSINNKVILIKTNAMGMLEWRKKINLSPDSYEMGLSIIQDSITRKFLIVGYRSIPSEGFLYITDSLGNLISQSIASNEMTSSLSTIKKLSNGNFIACGTIGTGEILGFYEINESILIKFDIEGNMLSTNHFGESGIVNGFGEMVLLPGDTVAAVGQYDSLYTEQLGLNSMYSIYKIDPSGNVIWHNYIDPVAQNGTQDIPKGLIATSDGGYAITGYTFNVSSPYILVKLDNNGCLADNCSFVASDTEIEKKDIEFSLYPNPANNFISIAFSTIQKENLCYKILDCTGKTIINKKILENSNTISTRLLSNSLYLFQLLSNNKVVGSKTFIINH